MYASLSITCAVIFVLYPPCILGYRFLKQKPQWWIILLSIVLLGWVCWLGAVLFHFQDLGEMVRSQENPSQELLDEWSSDGGPMVFALLFGWGIAAAYAALWIPIYALVAMIRSLFTKASLPASESTS